MALAFELKSREEKLRREQKERAEALRRKTAREQAARERAAKAKAERDEETRRRRLAEEEAAQEREARDVEERERNNGVLWHATLTAQPRDEAQAAAKGIARRADKAFLPRSAHNALMQQDAPKNGPMLFEAVSRVTGKRAHIGVLEFTAPEGAVQLPPHTLANLGGDAALGGAVDVRYAKLPKGTFARLQPLWAAFQQEVDDIKLVLEATLLTHSVLTVGDEVHVTDSAGVDHALRVRELQPADAVSVIDTDLETDIDISVEGEEMRRREEAARAEAEAALRRQCEAEAAEEERRAAAAAEAEREAAEAQQRRDAHAAAKASALPPEAEAGEPGVTEVQLRFADGRRAARRLRAGDALALLYDFCESSGAEPGTFRLVGGFPRRPLPPPADGVTVADAGIQGKQEALLVETIEATDAAPMES